MINFKYSYFFALSSWVKIAVSLYFGLIFFLALLWIPLMIRTLALTAFIALSLFLCLNLLSCSVADCKKLIGDNNLGGLACEEEEDKPPDCASINRDVNAIHRKYRSCNNDADCSVINVFEGCIIRCHLGVNTGQEMAFREEIRILSEQCIHIDRVSELGIPTCHPNLNGGCTLVYYGPACVSGQCVSH